MKHLLKLKLIFLVLMFSVALGSVLVMPANAESKIVGPFKYIKGTSLTKNGFIYAYADTANENNTYVVVNGVQYGPYDTGQFYEVGLYENGDWFTTYSKVEGDLIFMHAVVNGVDYTIKNYIRVFNPDSFAFISAKDCTDYPIKNTCTVVYKKPGQAIQQATLKSLGVDDDASVINIAVSSRGFVIATGGYVVVNKDGVITKYGPYRFLSNADKDIMVYMTENHFAFMYQKQDGNADIFFNVDGVESGPFTWVSQSYNTVGDNIIFATFKGDAYSYYVNGSKSNFGYCQINQKQLNNTSLSDYYLAGDNINKNFYFHGIWDGVETGEDYENVYQHLYRAKFNKSSIDHSSLSYYLDGNCLRSRSSGSKTQEIFINGVLRNSINSFEDKSFIDLTSNSWAYGYRKDGLYYIQYGLNESNPTSAGCDYSGCGDGVIDFDEVCDGSNLNGQTCSSQGFSGGTLKCANDCKSFDTSGCTQTQSLPDLTVSDLNVDVMAYPPESNGSIVKFIHQTAVIKNIGQAPSGKFVLGNYMGPVGGSRDTFQGLGVNEIPSIDPGGSYNYDAGYFNTVKGVMKNYPGKFQYMFYADVDCSTAPCKIGTGPNAVTESNETNNYLIKTFDMTQLTPYCGNTLIEGNEVCDGSNRNNQTCSSKGFTGGTLYCSDDCKSFNTSACISSTTTPSICGNGTIDSGEDCDGSNLNNQTCSSKGFAGGTLKCNSSCQFDTSSCTKASVSGVKCSDDLNSLGYTGFNTGETLSTLLANSDSTKINNLLDQVIAKNKGKFNLPNTYTPLVGDCTWMEHNTTGNCYIYSYKAGMKVSEYTDQTCNNTDSGKAKMLKALQSGQCCATTKTNKVSTPLTCNGNLNDYSYLSGFADGETLQTIKNNDAKLGQLVHQVLTNKGQIAGLTGRRLKDNLVPSTGEPVIGYCKWLEHWDTGNWYIYSYSSQRKVSAYTDVNYSNLSEGEARMIKAIKEGYCCGEATTSPSDSLNSTDQTINKSQTTITKVVDPDTQQLILQLQRRITDLEKNVVDLEKKLQEAIDKNLTKKVAGQVLLQVENNGEAWYVDPNTGNKFYIKDGQAAYDILRSFGKGISAADLAKVPLGRDANIYSGMVDSDGDGLPNSLEQAIGSDVSKVDTNGNGYNDSIEISNGYNPVGSGKYQIDTALVKRLGNGIFLQVAGDNANGQAWLIKDGYRYYLDPTNAYAAMRYLSLGISNDNLRKIQVGEYQGQ